MGCPYANLAGPPGTGYHAYRFLGLSVVDIIGTFLFFAVPTAIIFKENVWTHFAVWLVISEIIHYAFGAQTGALTMLGIKVNC
jgi:hypothetical protein